jgi:hypothetical protein
MKENLRLLALMVLFAITSRQGLAQTKNISGPSGSSQFGATVVVLTNGNYVVGDPYYELDGVPCGAAHLYDGKTHKLISTLTGSSAIDKVGSNVRALPNGNFVVYSPYWDNGMIEDAGAITWGNGVTGMQGKISAANSLIGSYDMQFSFATELIVLPSGNFVVVAPMWRKGRDENVGAVTWVDGSKGIAGEVSETNSLVGAKGRDAVGSGGITVLTNGNFVISSPTWIDPVTTNPGAATWVNGSKGIKGLIDEQNSLICSGTGVVALTNGNYVVVSAAWPYVNSIQGAATWCDGTVGRIGRIDRTTSLVSEKIGDFARVGIRPLTNGNYLVLTPDWSNNGISKVGAVTWCDGTKVTTGTVNATNSVIGTTKDEQLGAYDVVALTNGKYVISSPNWINDQGNYVGAIRVCDGNQISTGNLNSSNSLIGFKENDWQKYHIVGLPSGDFVTLSPYWKNQSGVAVGAVLWASSTEVKVGAANMEESALIGGRLGDFSGASIVPLSNSNYLVVAPNLVYQNLTGGVTWIQGGARAATISLSNTLIGVPNVGVRALPNGNYVVNSPDSGPFADKYLGALVWGDGTRGTGGTINPSNALLSFVNNAFSGYMIVVPIPNGDYYVITPDFPGNFPRLGPDTGAVTWLNGSKALSGEINSCNSVIAQTYQSYYRVTAAYNSVHKYLLVGRANDKIVSVFSPTGKMLGVTKDYSSVNVTSGLNPLLSDDCHLIASIVQGGSAPVSGIVNAKIWVEPTVPTFHGDPFVARHYEITPVDNAAGATGNITLFFSQKEFDDFNSASGSTLNLPTGPDDAEGKSHILIGQYHGVSGDGTGLPGSYGSSISKILDPDDNDIIWNFTFNRWEVSFNVEGFSGFVLQTSPNPLPVRLVSFSGNAEKNAVTLTWDVADAANFSHFEVERSTDAENFQFVDKVNFEYWKPTYGLQDQPRQIAGARSGNVYYRLKMIDTDGSYAYSNTIHVKIGLLQVEDHALVYPNPVKEVLTVILNEPEGKVVFANVADADGRVLFRNKATVTEGKVLLDFSKASLPVGVHLLSIDAIDKSFKFKIVKED